MPGIGVKRNSYHRRNRKANLCQDLALAALSGDVEPGKLAQAVPDYVKKIYKEYPLKFGNLSLDQPAPGWDEGRLADLIAS